MGDRVDHLNREERVAACGVKHFLDTRIDTGAEAISRDLGNRGVGQRGQSDVLDSNTIGRTDGKTDIVGSAGQYPHDGYTDEPSDQRPQRISADPIGPLHVVDGDEQALPVSQPR
jgi:hypothetical protein